MSVYVPVYVLFRSGMLAAWALKPIADFERYSQVSL